MIEAYKPPISGDSRVAGTHGAPLLGLLLRSDFSELAAKTRNLPLTRQILLQPADSHLVLAGQPLCTRKLYPSGCMGSGSLQPGGADNETVLRHRSAFQQPLPHTH